MYKMDINRSFVNNQLVVYTFQNVFTAKTSTLHSGHVLRRKWQQNIHYSSRTAALLLDVTGRQDQQGASYGVTPPWRGDGVSLRQSIASSRAGRSLARETPRAQWSAAGRGGC